MRFDLSVDGDVQISRRLLRLGDRVEDARPAFRRVADDLMGIERQQFASQGGRAHAWPPLAQATQEAKSRAGLDPRILQATGRLRDSLTGRSGDQKLLITDTFMIFGTNVKYAGYHQGGRGVPQRRYLDLTAMDRRRLVKTLQRELIGGLR